MEMFNSTANHSTQSKKEFLLVFFFVLLAANPFLRQNIEMSIAVLFIYLLICFGKVFYLKQNDVLALLIITYFIAFEIAHRLLFDLDNTYTIVRIITYFLAGFSVIKVTKSNFLIHYTRAIYILSLISIAFYIIALILPTTYNNLSNLSAVIFPLTPDYNNYMTPTLIFYTFDPAFIANKAYLRNPGFAWEAGGFATYVNIAIFFYLVKSGINNIPEFFKNKVILVLTTSLLLTFSTSGYICFAFIILMFFIGKISSKNYIFLILFVHMA